MSPIDIATKRREADRDELARAREAGDWGVALDVLHANLHEIESLVLRSLVKHEATQTEIAALGGLIETLLGRVGDLIDKIEHPVVPSYRPTAASASNLDAQALGQSIESVYAELNGSQMAIVGRVAALEAVIGVAPDEIRGAKGTGLAGIVHRLNSRATLAKLALLAAVASAFGNNVGELAKWLFHALKG